MRVNLARTLLAVAGMIVAGPALAQDVMLTGQRDVIPQVPDTASYYAQSGDDSANNYYLTGDPSATPSAGIDTQNTGACDTCNAGADCSDLCDSCCATCNNCPCRNLILFSAVDSWRGIGDNLGGNNSNNDGVSTGANYGMKLGRFSDLTGIGLQVGGSYGIYDFNGRPATPGVLSTTTSQQQSFFTVGLFKRANDRSNWSYGIAHDYMFNQGFGSFAVNPTLGQWRGQVSYATNAWNEFGVWATLRDKGSTNTDSLGNPVYFRAIDQGNLFWHHKWQMQADSWVWIGIPQENRLDNVAGGSLGNFLVGGSFIAPLNDFVSLYANAQYMHPSAAAGPAGYSETSWYISFGLQYYVGGFARTNTVAGNCWAPLMPVGNNGNFLVDSYRRVALP